MTRPLRLPQQLFAAIDKDAARCRRSANKQIEAILTAYYQIDEVELADLAHARSLVGPHPQAIQNGGLQNLASEIAAAIQGLPSASDRGEMIDQIKELATEARILTKTPPKRTQKARRKSS